MYIAICDNELSFAALLADAVKDYFALHDLTYNKLATYTSANELLADYADKNTLDILFLDIDMPEMSGMELARKLRLAHSNALIVFVTSHPEFMATSFQVEAFDFLTKPISANDISAVLKRCIKKYEQRYAKLMVKIPKGTAVIYLHNLLYVASNTDPGRGSTAIKMHQESLTEGFSLSLSTIKSITAVNTVMPPNSSGTSFSRPSARLSSSAQLHKSSNRVSIVLLKMIRNNPRLLCCSKRLSSVTDIIAKPPLLPILI